MLARVEHLPDLAGSDARQIKAQIPDGGRHEGSLSRGQDAKGSGEDREGMTVPDVRYTRTDGGYVAYQVVGDGPIDVVFTVNWFGHLAMRWEEPNSARFLDRLASFSRLIMFDKRGSGMSDPVPLDAPPTLEDWMDDLRAVMDAVGSERAAQFASLGGARMSILFAASHPERASHLVLFNSIAAGLRSPDNPWGPTAEQLLARNDQNLNVLLGREFPAEIARREAQSPGYVEWYRSYMRACASPGTWEALGPVLQAMDVCPVLPAVNVPTLVISRGNPPGARQPVLREWSRYIAGRIRGAKFVELPGHDTQWMFGDSEALLGEIEEFLTGVRNVPVSDRVLATILFTDIVGSTTQLARMGDSPWRALLGKHDEMVRREIARHKGREVSTAGDGFLVTFDGPARAIQCARAIVEAAQTFGVNVRAGLHTGEIELDGNDIRGIAVHIGARISALAGPGEVLVSSTVRDLVAGSGIEFDDRGTHELKGVPGEWHIFAVTG